MPVRRGDHIFLSGDSSKSRMQTMQQPSEVTRRSSCPVDRPVGRGQQANKLDRLLRIRGAMMMSSAGPWSSETWLWPAGCGREKEDEEEARQQLNLRWVHCIQPADKYNYWTWHTTGPVIRSLPRKANKGLRWRRWLSFLCQHLWEKWGHTCMHSGGSSPLAPGLATHPGPGPFFSCLLLLLLPTPALVRNRSPCLLISCTCLLTYIIIVLKSPCMLCVHSTPENFQFDPFIRIIMSLVVAAERCS